MAQLFPQIMTANNTPSPYVASTTLSVSTGNEPYRAFDGDTGTWFLNNAGGGAANLTIDLGLANAFICVSYMLQMESDNFPNRAPKTWTFNGSNNGSTWTTLDTQASQTGWGNGESRFFTFTNSTSYRYYQIVVTANNGDGTYTGFAALYGYNVTDLPVSAGDGAALKKTAYVGVIKCPPPFIGSGGGAVPSPVAVQLKGGVKNVPYTETISAVGGTPPYTFTLSSGGVPTGCSLSSSGIISGTPSAVGTYSFTVEVTDSLGNFGLQAFEIQIDLAAVSGGSWITIG